MNTAFDFCFVFYNKHMPLLGKSMVRGHANIISSGVAIPNPLQRVFQHHGQRTVSFQHCDASTAEDEIRLLNEKSSRREVYE